MTRKERQRRQNQAERLKPVQLQLVVAGYLGTMGLIADELEAGLLDPGTHRRVEFIAEIRRLQESVAGDLPEGLTRLTEAFADEPKVRGILAEQEEG